MKKNAGFTMVEMLIVIALIGIISAIAVPNFSSWLPRHRLNSAANMIRGDLYKAKVLAAKSKHQYKVVFGTADYEMQEGDKRSGSSAWTPDILERSFSDYPGITVKSVSANPIFNPRGTVEDAISITLKNASGGEAVIQVSYGGRIKVG